MSQSLKLEIQILDDQAKVEICGPVDEDSNFEKIQAIKQDIFVLNLNKVSLMNSCGVREWINLVESLPKSSTIIYENVPQLVVEQMNMVKGFLTPNSQIKSFYAPYYNEDNDKITAVLLTSEQIKDGKAPEMKDEDGKELEFDAIEAQYFNFLKQQA